MKLKLVVFAFCLFFIGSMAFAADYYIPQIAMGSYEQGGITYVYSTTFVFFNNTDTGALVSVALTDNDGNALKADISGLAKNTDAFSFGVGAGGTRILEVTSPRTVATGAATITSNSDIGVSGIYTIRNKATGAFVTEVGVQASPLMDSFVIPVQVTANGSVATGLALYNPADSDSQLTLSLKNEDGTSAGNASLTLAAGKQTAFYVTEKFSSIQGITFSGTLKIVSTGAISATTLRQNAPSNLTYTSIPVVPTTSTQMTFNLAHFADGLAGGTPYKTTFMLFNFGTSSATVTLTPTKDNGTELPLTMTDGSTGPYTIPAGGSKFLVTNGTANDQGAIIITSTNPIGAAALFTQYNNDMSFNTEAGVQDSQTLVAFTLPIDSVVSLDGSQTISDTGVAFFNPGSSDVTFTPNFLDNAGLITASTTSITLPAKGHYANFFSALFPQKGNVQGSVSVSGLANGVSAMTLRMNSEPFSMTTLPVISGAATGYQAAASGTPTRKKLGGVIATADTTVNAMLPYGYAVTIAPTITGGTVWNQYGGLGVRAFSAGNTFTTTSSGAGYTANLPPGDYQFNVESYVGDQTTAFYWFYTSNLVTITSNATVPITATFPTLYTVTGSVSGTSTTAGMFVLSDASGSGSYGYGIAGGSTYSISVAPGTYQMSYAVNWQGGGPYISNLGTVTVSDANTTGPDIVIPTSANISGAAHFTGAPPASSTIAAKNRAGINAQAFALDTRTVTAASGAYQNLPLTPGDLYTMSLSYPVGFRSTYDGVNCGGPANGNFAAEQYNTVGTTVTTTSAINMDFITDGTPMAIFQSARYTSSTGGGLIYTIPNLTPDAEYNVTLYFAYMYGSMTVVRIQNVYINDVMVLENMNMLTEGGAYKAFAKKVTGFADANGQMVIRIAAGTGNTASYVHMNGFRIEPVESTSAKISATIAQGTIDYTPVSDNPITITGDATYDFVAPVSGASEFVTISGTVKNPDDAAVSGATVTATSSVLDNATAPGAIFTSTTATTATDGAYSLKVLPGRQYTLTITR